MKKTQEISQFGILILILSGCSQGASVKATRTGVEDNAGTVEDSSEQSDSDSDSSETQSGGEDSSGTGTGSAGDSMTSESGGSGTAGAGTGSGSGTGITPDPPPPEPVAFDAQVNSSTQITLNWSSGGGSTDGFIIAYTQGASAPSDCTSGTVIPAAQITGTSKVISDLSPSSQYSIRVCAINGNALPDISDGVTDSATTTPSDGLAPNAPTTLALEDGVLSLIGTWPNSTGGAAVTGYLLVRNATGVVTWTPTPGTNYTSGQSLDGTHKAVYVGTELEAEDAVLAPGNTYYYAVFAYDVEKDYSAGVVGSKLLRKQIYRSVQAGASASLAIGTSNTLNISDNVASFALDLPDHIGVGDALEYDADNNGSIDQIAFISRRISANQYVVLTSSAGSATDTNAADNDWKIFRAYTSLFDAEAGTENTGINDSVESYETFANGRDLPANDENWNVALYGSYTPDILRVQVAGWTTGPNHYLQIYTPTKTSEVGVSQRHQGIWDDSLYRLVVNIPNMATSMGILEIDTGYVKLAGIQFDMFKTAQDEALGVWFRHNGVQASEVAQNIFRGFANPTSNEFPILLSILPSPSDSDSGTVRIWNNILYDLNTSATYAPCIYLKGNLTAYVYNNTIFNCKQGIMLSTEGTMIAINNIVQGASDGYAGTLDAASNYNISDLAADAPGANSIQATVDFVDVGQRNFHLDPTDTSAVNTGTDLTNDVNIPFKYDFVATTRSDWDIGASEKPETAKAPIAFAQSREVNTNTDRSVTLKGLDFNWQALSYSIVSGPSHGTLDTSALPDVIYTPDNAYTGTDSFTYKVSDGTLESAPASVSLSIGVFTHRMALTVSTYQIAVNSGAQTLDTICQREAATLSAGGGLWKALVSTDTEDVKDRLLLELPIKNYGGENMAADATDLWDGSIDNLLSFDFAGTDHDFMGYLTGSQADGTKYAGKTCNNWTSGAVAEVRQGEAHESASGWISNTMWGDCSHAKRFACVDRQ